MKDKSNFEPIIFELLKWGVSLIKLITKKRKKNERHAN